jgi:hypothetical protein
MILLPVPCKYLGLLACTIMPGFIPGFENGFIEIQFTHLHSMVPGIY